jgi:hypothetical protein
MLFNAGVIPNYGGRNHHGERISTGFVESTVNQVVALQKGTCDETQEKNMRGYRHHHHAILSRSLQTETPVKLPLEPSTS